MSMQDMGEREKNIINETSYSLIFKNGSQNIGCRLTCLQQREGKINCNEIITAKA